MDDKAFREAFTKEITEYVKEAEASELVELYNKFSQNEVEMNEDNFTIKTPETAEVIADAEKAEAPADEEQVDEKVVDGVQTDRNTSEPHAKEKADDDEEEKEEEDDDKAGEVPMLDKDFDEGEEVELEVSAEDKFTNDLDPADKK